MNKLFCNPMEISYKYQHPLSGKYAYKEAADPTLIYFNDMYLLFTSKCGGFYYSKDLYEWEYHEDKNLEIHCYAPDVNVHDGYLYFCASNAIRKSKILRTKDPFKGFQKVSAPFAFWDPHLYFEDEKAYLYWGCSCKEPIWGIELDQKTMMPKGEKQPIVIANPSEHGIDDKDLFGDIRTTLWQKYIALFTGSGTFIEGAFVNKFNGKYYFQYAAPGTEFPTYGNAVCIGDSPLGEYTFQTHNPYSIVPGGYTQGAGHGSTFEDEYGNLWHTASICVGVNHGYERRLGLWPAGIDEDGILFCNQYFADYPKERVTSKVDPMSIGPEWMLLSYKKKTIASSFEEGCGPENTTDENIKTIWQSKTGEKGEYLELDLGESFQVHAVQVNFGDYHNLKKNVSRYMYGGTMSQERYIDTDEVLYGYKVEYSLNKDTWIDFGDGECKTSFPHHMLEDDVKARFVRVTFIEAPYGQKFTISGLRVFGIGESNLPKRSVIHEAKRISYTRACFAWKTDVKTNGSCIRIGIAPDKLYNSILLYGVDHYQVTFLNKEAENYFYAIDTFNENGITKGEVMQLC